MEADEWAEYRDAAFLARVGLDRLTGPLAAFWPVRGPQWDALGLAGESVVLVEAKAHLDELFSPPCAAGTSSLHRIDHALNSVREALGVRGGASWTDRFYQLANRIAHLYFLRSHGVDARLLLVGFVGDAEMGGPLDAGEWETAYRTAAYAMGLARRHALSPFIHHVHPPVSALAHQASERPVGS
ncbi:MAG: hypothetical protein K5872_17485 [Rhizobiaceae bacterium]|nr:hypothetical protein [Rhizobiaceae bacterium]MCV0408018.1 hypothetical protein [Rhizobiaceae bacterium]